jgi:hypothetical protein
VLAELRPRVAPEGAPGPGARQVGLWQGVLGAGAVAPQAVKDAAAEGAPGSGALELDQLLTVPGLRERNVVKKGGFRMGYRGGFNRGVVGCERGTCRKSTVERCTYTRSAAHDPCNLICMILNQVIY